MSIFFCATIKVVKIKKTYIGFLRVSGPRVITAKDLKLPAGIQCVDPNQYIATLTEDGFINMKFICIKLNLIKLIFNKIKMSEII